MSGSPLSSSTWAARWEEWFSPEQLEGTCGSLMSSVMKTRWQQIWPEQLDETSSTEELQETHIYHLHQVKHSLISTTFIGKWLCPSDPHSEGAVAPFLFQPGFTLVVLGSVCGRKRGGKTDKIMYCTSLRERILSSGELNRWGKSLESNNWASGKFTQIFDKHFSILRYTTLYYSKKKQLFFNFKRPIHDIFHPLVFQK